MLPFRTFHVLELIKEYELSFSPLDVFVNNYLKKHKAIGSKDRKFIRDKVFLLIRNRGLLDFLLDEKKLEISWKNRYLELLDPNFDLRKNDPNYPEFLKLGFSQELYEVLYKEYGLEGVYDFYQVNQTEAPLTIRINPLKTSRDFLMTLWKDVYQCVLCKKAPLGIKFLKKYPLNHLPEFKKGFFEIQDESSQQTISVINFSKQDKVLDFCAGSGGKSLAFSHLVNKVYLFDIRTNILKKARQRFQKAEIKNYEIFFSLKNMKNFEKFFDVVIIDAPCSGTGTFRRNPEKIWNFSIKELNRLILLQRKIVKKALTFLKPKGKLIYITCSILLKENEEQIAFFEKNYGLEVNSEVLKIWPKKQEGDGFFSVCLVNKNC